MRCTGLVTAVVLILATGCAGPGSDPVRTAIVHDFLLADNAVWRSREPAPLAAKYQAMAADPYDFMRGTAGLFYADTARPGPERATSLFGTSHGARTVLLVGDPHPENLGLVLPGDTAGPIEGERAPELLLEWVDLDAATHGPWILDLRRAALGLSAFTLAMDGCDDTCRDLVIPQLAQGYTDALAAAALGADPLAGATTGWLWHDLLDEASEEGAERKQLGKRTTLNAAGKRVLDVPNALDDEGKGLFDPTPGDEARISGILAGLPSKPAGFRVLDTARRHGQGVSSRPALRYIVLFDTGADGPQDDELLNCRELIGPPTIPGAPSTVPGLFASDAARLSHARSTLWSRPDADGRAGEAKVGNQSFKCQRWSSYQQAFDHGKAAEAWTEEDIDQQDLWDLARLVGASLAATHARSLTLDGEPALAVITADLDGRPSQLAQELTSTAARDLDTLLADHTILNQLLDTHGPWLGAEDL